MIAKAIVLTQENEEDISRIILNADGERLEAIKELLEAMGLEYRWSGSAGRYDLIDYRE